MNDLIKALQILLKYCDPEERTPTHCEHDVLYITCVKYKDISEEDKKALDELGFFEDSENGGIKSFRFGMS